MIVRNVANLKCKHNGSIMRTLKSIIGEIPESIFWQNFKHI